MNKLFDPTPLEPILEHYIGFNIRDTKKDLSLLSMSELKQDLAQVEKDITDIYDEIESTKTHAPVYCIKEQLKNLELAKEQILEEINKRDSDKTSGKQLDKKYEKNLSNYKKTQKEV